MRHVFKNSFLVFVLAGLFALPSMGFGFAQYREDNSRAVLGVSDQPVVASVVSPTSDTKKPEVQQISASNGIEIFDQIEFKIGLNSEPEQTYYDIVPSEYLTGEYSFIVVAPKDLLDKEVEFNLITNDMTADMVVNLPSGFKPKGTLTYPVTVLVVR